MHILLATKGSDLRIALEMLLSEEPGVHISGTASNSDGLLALLGSTQPDLVLLDEDLPGDHLQSTLTKAQTCCSDTKFIVLGLNSSAQESILKDGADAYAVKGDPPEKLLDTFRRLSV